MDLYPPRATPLERLLALFLFIVVMVSMGLRLYWAVAGALVAMLVSLAHADRRDKVIAEASAAELVRRAQSMTPSGRHEAYRIYSERFRPEQWVREALKSMPGGIEAPPPEPVSQRRITLSGLGNAALVVWATLITVLSLAVLIAGTGGHLYGLLFGPLMLGIGLWEHRAKRSRSVLSSERDVSSDRDC
jgi:pimeloyl-ACP methyl ester carboxylesterase